MAKVELPVERPTTKNLRNKLVDKQMTIFHLVDQDPVNWDKVRKLQGQVEKGAMTLTGSKEYNEKSANVVEEIQKTAKNKPRPQSLLEKGIRKLMGKRGGGSVGYTQRWKNARKKNG